MSNSSLFNKFLASSPYIEVFVRHLYWRNIHFFKRFKSGSGIRKNFRSVCASPNTFSNILDYLGGCGVSRGSLLIIHSGFRPLQSTGKSPEQIIQYLMDFLGTDGTLAMPAMPKYINEIDPLEYINKDISNIIFNYDVKKTGITTGVLPKTLCSWEGAIRSRCPINTMVAVGPLAFPMMKNNLQGSSPLPCGINSSWNFCHNNNAHIVALGVDMAHSLTMIHVAEDLLDEKWPIHDWYRNRHFTISDNDFRTEITLRERHPRWGTLYYAERTLYKDLMKENIMRTTEINGITVECLKAKELIQYLNSRNHLGYPYYCVNKYAKKNCS